MSEQGVKDLIWPVGKQRQWTGVYSGGYSAVWAASSQGIWRIGEELNLC